MCSATPVLLFLFLILLRAFVIFFVSDILELDENVPVVYLFTFIVLGTCWTFNLDAYIPEFWENLFYYFLYKSYVMFSHPSFILSLSGIPVIMEVQLPWTESCCL